MCQFKKILLLLIFLLGIKGISSAQTTLGTGLLSVSFNEETVLFFYNNPGDKVPAKNIEFFNDKSINSWNIKNLKTQKEWLNPEVLWLDYSPLVFRVKTVKDPWFQVVVNNTTGKYYWIKTNKSTSFLTWQGFLKDKFGVSRLTALKQKIRKLPSLQSTEIFYKGKDCFQVKSMKGDWIEIFSAEYCDDSYTDTKNKVKSGWIKWREGNKLLIEYFITS
jgi:hypothetical protein